MSVLPGYSSVPLWSVLPIVGVGWWVEDEMEVGGSRIRDDESLHSGGGEALHHGTVRERERERAR